MFPEQLFVSGELVHIIFQSPSTFYKVLSVKVQETNTDFKEEEMKITGSFGDIQEGESYRFFGQMGSHAKYGEQFNCETYQKEQPTSENGIINYLSSEKFPGIGKKTAEKIVDLLGESAIDRMLEDPSLLKQIPTLTEKKQQMMLETIRLNYGMDQIIVGLGRYGFGSKLSFDIYQMYKSEALEIIEENPYQLVEDIEGIGFKKADDIAERIGIGATSPKRMRAAILHQIFAHSANSGDTFIPAKILLSQTIDLLETSRPVEIRPDQLADVMIELVEEGKIQQDGTNLYENSLYFAEWGIATSIQRLMQRKKEINYPEKQVDKVIRKIEKKLGILYGDSQEVAIREAIRSPFFILTGGPGTGKTTIINGIVQLFAELNEVDLDPSKYTDETFPILLAAPTGRAAKRMNETTGLPSGTIHRLLGLNGREKSVAMSPKELEGGLLIVDEMSMVDTWLANTLLKAISTNMQIIFVGDKDQLPSVGPGQVLHDLLSIEEIPKQELTKIYRQGNDSTIISLAHEIKNGHLPKDFLQKQSDRSFIPRNEQTVQAGIRQVAQKAKVSGFTAQDIQVLSPMYRGPGGVNELNKTMQEIFNPNPMGTNKEVVGKDEVYRIGDKVLQLVNSPEENVFNGDMGMIVGIIYAKDSEDKQDELVIQFDANEVTYKRSEWHQITLAYCCTIHKAQGSEFRMVLMPMLSYHRRMLQRNLLYTAITRSKEKLILFGEPNAYQQCVEQESNLRNTTLQQRISGVDQLSPSQKEQIDQFEEAEEAFEAETTDSMQEAVSEKKLEKTVEEETQTSLFSEEIIENNDLPDYLTVEMVKNSLIDPMIGMENISPYDFQLSGK